MFFPAEPDSLSPLNTYVIPYKPPPAPMRTLDLNSMHGPSVTGIPVDYMIRAGFQVPTYIDTSLVLK